MAGELSMIGSIYIVIKHTKWSPALVPHNLIRSETEIKMKKKRKSFIINM